MPCSLLRITFANLPARASACRVQGARAVACQEICRAVLKAAVLMVGELAAGVDETIKGFETETSTPVTRFFFVAESAGFISFKNGQCAATAIFDWDIFHCYYPAAGHPCFGGL